jgi:hypothetical protein
MATILYDLKQNPPRFIIYTNESYLAKIPFSDSGFLQRIKSGRLSVGKRIIFYVRITNIAKRLMKE